MKTIKEKEYIGAYKVVKIFRKSNRKQIISRGLTREEAKTIVNRYADSNTVLYWRRSGLLSIKLIRSTNVDATTNVHTKH